MRVLAILRSRPLQETCKGGKGFVTRVMFQPFGIRFGGVRIQSNRDEEANHQLVPAACKDSQRQPRVREEQSTIGPGLHQPVALQARNGCGDRGRCNAHSPGNVHGPCLAFLCEEIGDEFDISLSHGGPVRFALLREAGRLMLSDGQATPGRVGHRLNQARVISSARRTAWRCQTQRDEALPLLLTLNQE